MNPSHLIDVSRITPDLLKQAASKLKSGKSDPIYSFSSDCFKNGAELIDLKHGSLVKPDGWSEGELDIVMNFACTQ